MVQIDRIDSISVINLGGSTIEKCSDCSSRISKSILITQQSEPIDDDDVVVEGESVWVGNDASVE